MKRKRVELWLAIAGVIVLAPGAFWLFSDRLNDDDVNVAFTKLARVPLDHLEKTGSATLIVTTPNSVQWQRIRRLWGDPGYILVAVSPPERNLVYCFERLGILVEVRRGASRIPVEPAGAPYGFSTECQIDGVSFRVPPGAELTVSVTATSQHPLPAGELMLMTYWDSAAKDRIVGVMLDEDLGKVLRITSAVGLALMVVAACIRVRRRAGRRETTS